MTDDNSRHKTRTRWVRLILIAALLLLFGGFFLTPIYPTGSHFCSPPAGSNVCAGHTNIFESYESFGCVTLGIGGAYANGQYSIGCSWLDA
jgi:hypothetical protein